MRVSVSYTHLDVYKRQAVDNTVIPQYNSFGRLEIKSTCVHLDRNAVLQK